MAEEFDVAFGLVDFRFTGLGVVVGQSGGFGEDVLREGELFPAEVHGEGVGDGVDGGVDEFEAGFGFGAEDYDV
jgi:hypothetical protein